MGQTTVRPEIQALRAAAVLIVVLYHLWPLRLTGGFVGVDVFFVVSGFLITSHLLREVTRTGTISLGRFWARRARRLLPASLLVLVVVLAMTLAVVPDSYWRQWMGEVSASAVYGQNWLLAFDAVDYLAAHNAASPVQHFWSLSLEEQFYVVWPLLMVLVTAAARGRSERATRAMLLTAVVVVGLVSLVVSVFWTSRMPASAYFVTPTRMWEFAAGGLLAFVPTVIAENRRTQRSLLSLTGFVAIAWAAVTFNGATAFPGSAALLPVLGTVAVIAAGCPTGPWSLRPLLALPPVQFLGDVSYSMYLWHWPFIVVVPIVTAAPLTTAHKAAILGASVLVAWLTKVGVEDRFRGAPVVQRARPRRVLAAAVAASIGVAAGGAAVVQVLDARIASAAQATLDATVDACFGAAAMDVVQGCGDPFAITGMMTPAFAKTDTNAVADPAGGWQCETPRGESALRRCEFGDTTGPVRTIAMLGDSHAMHYMAALRALAEERGWRVVTYFKSACSGTGASDVVLPDRPDDQQACAAWGTAAHQAIAADRSIDTVIFANWGQVYLQDNGAREIQPSRYAAAWDALSTAGKTVVVIRDLPRTVDDADVPDCLSTHAANPTVCDTQQSVSLHRDAAAEAAAGWPDGSVRLLDLTEKYCRDGVCHARIGGAIVYSDAGHLTNTFARSLAPYIGAALDRP
ncbi:acyltransferase family protein [Blastococcus sp. CT_GayMR20]|uniref:acyltransferase family protein n=1 Tax=Blastococcus sp. CT_GayMR20 TaxID=2559609 RepID=UPI00143047C3|nr:acyltransferase family protein [Blastococcus sp. CT_GayMR20]